MPVVGEGKPWAAGADAGDVGGEQQETPPPGSGPFLQLAAFRVLCLNGHILAPQAAGSCSSEFPRQT